MQQQEYTILYKLLAKFLFPYHHFPIVQPQQWGFNQIIYRNITKITLPITFVNPFIALATPYNDDKDVSGNYLAGFAIRNLTNTDFKINQADVGLYASWIAIGY